MPCSGGYNWLVVQTLTSSIWGSSGEKPFQTTSFPTCAGKNQWTQKIEWYGRQWPEWPDLIIHFIFIYCFSPISFLKGVRRDYFCVILAHVTSDPTYLELNVEWWSVVIGHNFLKYTKEVEKLALNLIYNWKTPSQRPSLCIPFSQLHTGIIPQQRLLAAGQSQ